MNNSTVNLTSETSTNSSNHFINLVESLNFCAYSIAFLFGLPTHSYITWLIVTGTGRAVALVYFILNLSVCEIGNSVNGLLLVLSYWFSNLSMLTVFLLGLIIAGRPLFQCLMCVERYLAVVHPVTFLKFKPLRYKAICCTVAWIITLGFCLFSMFAFNSVNNITYTWLFSLPFILFLSIKLFCLVAVLRALKQSGPGERGKKREEENHMKRRAFYLILITTLSMVITYLPYTIISFFTLLTQQYVNVLWCIGLVCYVLAGFVQPVLYLHQAGKFSLCSKLRCLLPK